MKLFISVILFFSFNNAYSWTFIARSEIGADFYVDLNSKERNGRLFTAYTLTNWDVPQMSGGMKVKSTIYKYEFDCVENRQRKRFGSVWSGNMGNGAELHTWYIEGEWEYSKPGSTRGAIIDFVCNH